jgi:hypothetical protein
MNLTHDESWRHKSLAELENEDWGDSSDAPTLLVTRCIDLSKVPINRYELYDLRVMIGQKFGLPYLIPLAIERLQFDIFVDTEYYEGDLLAAVLDVNVDFWKSNPAYWKQVELLIRDKDSQLRKFKISTEKFQSAKP